MASSNKSLFAPGTSEFQRRPRGMQGLCKGYQDEVPSEVTSMFECK